MSRKLEQPRSANGRNSTAADRHPGTKNFHKISFKFLSWFIAVIQFLILWLVRSHGAPEGLGAFRLSLVSLLGNPPLLIREKILDTFAERIYLAKANTVLELKDPA